MPQRPESAGELIRNATKGKLPNYFLYAKDKTASQVEPPNNSTMNRISQAVPNTRIKITKMVDKFDYRVLMNLDYDFEINENNKIVERYNYWNRHQYLFNTEDENVKQEEVYIFKCIRDKILEETQEDINVVVNTLVMYLYTIKPNTVKKTLWASFGDVLVENIKANTESMGRPCAFCGDRFRPVQPSNCYCSDECFKASRARALKARRRYATPKKKEKVEKVENLT